MKQLFDKNYLKQLFETIIRNSFCSPIVTYNTNQENQKLVDEKTAIHRKFTRLQDYLTNLPTVNEFVELKEKVGEITGIRVNRLVLSGIQLIVVGPLGVGVFNLGTVFLGAFDKEFYSLSYRFVKSGT